MSNFFKSYTVGELLEIANEPVDYGSMNDIQSLHHLRNEINNILFQNNKISGSVRNTLELLVNLINNEIETSLGLR